MKKKFADLNILFKYFFILIHPRKFYAYYTHLFKSINQKYFIIKYFFLSTCLHTFLFLQPIKKFCLHVKIPSKRCLFANSLKSRDLLVWESLPQHVVILLETNWLKRFAPFVVISSDIESTTRKRLTVTLKVVQFRCTLLELQR